MTKTKGKNPIDLNHPISVGGDVQAYFDGLGIWLTFPNPLNDEMSHVCLDSSTFEKLVRFAKDRVGGEFAAAVGKIGKEA